MQLRMSFMYFLLALLVSPRIPSSADTFRAAAARGCLLGILPQCLLGVAIWIVGGLGTVDVKLHGFGVPKCRYFDGFGSPETWLKCSK